MSSWTAERKILRQTGHALDGPSDFDAPSRVCWLVSLLFGHRRAWAVKSPTDKQRAHIADVLRRLREHFHEWPCPAGYEHDLMGFAYYEGCGHRWACCREILNEASPFAVGQALVANHGFRWVMIRSGRSWRYGVKHPALDRPIDLASLQDGSWNEEEYDQPPSPGKMTLDSLQTIVERVRKIAPDAEPTPAPARGGSKASRGSRSPRRPPIHVNYLAKNLSRNGHR